MDFPSYADAPSSLLAADGHCGLLTAWTVLRYFGKRVSATKVIKACRYTRRYGVFTIGLATALAEHGLSVQFHTQRDPQPTPLERRLYRRAHQLGISICPAMTLTRLAATVKCGSIPVVFWNTPDDVGHFSPLLGVRRGRVLLPNTMSGSTSVAEFEYGWRQPGIMKQAIVVGRPPNIRLERSGSTPTAQPAR